MTKLLVMTINDLECVYCLPNLIILNVLKFQLISSYRVTRDLRLAREFVINFSSSRTALLHCPWSIGLSMYLCNNLSLGYFFVMQQSFHVSEKVGSKCPII